MLVTLVYTYLDIKSSILLKKSKCRHKEKTNPLLDWLIIFNLIQVIDKHLLLKHHLLDVFSSKLNQLRDFRFYL